MLKYEELPEVNSERWLSLEDLEGEEWRDVVKYEDRLSISNYGRLKRKNCISYNSHTGNCFYKAKIIRLQYTDYGYAHASISVGNNKVINLSIHRNVALAFVPNPQNLPMVNHKDENPHNNTLSNLEWCTGKYNSNYGTLKERQRQARIDIGESVAVVLYDDNGNIIKEYETAKDAGKDIGISRGTVINCCNGVCQTARGFHFRYKGVPFRKREIIYNRFNLEVYKDYKLILKTDNLKEMCNFLNVDYGAIRRIVRYNGKYSSLLVGYTICVHTPDNNTFYIENGHKKYNYNGL